MDVGPSAAVNPRPIPPGLQQFWSGPVSTFATLPDPGLSPEWQERHRIYSQCLMAILWRLWNGNKYGETGDYGAWRTNQLIGPIPSGGNVYQGGSYLGHNIGALAVDYYGQILDYDFNHNNVFDSSVEHAESRLVRRLFALNQVYDPLTGDVTPNPPRTSAARGPRTAHRKLGDAVAARDRSRRNRRFATAVSDRALSAPSPDAAQVVSGYSSLLSDVTLYTSLESCAQCSGIMTLASVKEIVYMQWDQGEFLVGNLMYQATQAQNALGQGGFTAPRPIRGDDIGMDSFMALNNGNDAFSQQVVQQPFYRDGSFVANTPSVTSYLCTDGAYQIYANVAATFLWGYPDMPLQYPDFAPGDQPGFLTNAEVLSNALVFYAYVDQLGNRGTAHRV
jgi:tRNA(Arg) A34 adenosine deaminase TadA